jgi:hypothetical protein
MDLRKGLVLTQRQLVNKIKNPRFELVRWENVQVNMKIDDLAKIAAVGG